MIFELIEIVCALLAGGLLGMLFELIYETKHLQALESENELLRRELKERGEKDQKTQVVEVLDRRSIDAGHLFDTF